MTPIWQTVAVISVALAAILFVGFAACVLWKLISGEADRLEAERKAREVAQRDT